MASYFLTESTWDWKKWKTPLASNWTTEKNKEERKKRLTYDFKRNIFDYDSACSFRLQVNNFFRKPIELVIKKFVFQMKMLVWPFTNTHSHNSLKSASLSLSHFITFSITGRTLFGPALKTRQTWRRRSKKTFVKSSKSLTAITWRNKSWANEEKPQRY